MRVLTTKYNVCSKNLTVYSSAGLLTARANQTAKIRRHAKLKSLATSPVKGIAFCCKSDDATHENATIPIADGISKCYTGYTYCILSILLYGYTTQLLHDILEAHL